jgi:hypothetical protein
MTYMEWWVMVFRLLFMSPVDPYRNPNDYPLEVFG